jgi:hypothetical protein
VRFLFTISGRAQCYKFFLDHSDGPWGIILYPSLEPGQVSVGDRLELRRPDGTTVKTSVEALFLTRPYSDKVEIKLSRLIFLHEVPRGTDVWVLEDEDVW